MKQILVVGGGAAGMMAALSAAEAGASVTLLEHNEKLGKKIYITGKGRCNLTNDCGLDDFLAQVARNPRFLYSALSRFGPRDMMALLESSGCPVTVQRGQRVFPASEKASDVTRALTQRMARAGVCVRLNTTVQSILCADGRITGVELADGSHLPAEAVILATGGMSYPATGSTGDGFRLAAEMGHRVFPPRPSLVGLETREDWPRALQGLSLRNVGFTLRRGKKTLYAEQGEMLFTHFGISGPLALEASCHLPDAAEGCTGTLDLKPALTREQVDARLRRELTEGSRKAVRNIMPSLLPGKLAEIFPSLCDVAGDTPCNQITGPQRERLAARLKALEITLRAPRPLAEAIVTRGGVDVKEIDPATMQSRLVPGLYIAGELLDVDAHTGGFNLQIAWSTGRSAGLSAAQI